MGRAIEARGGRPVLAASSAIIALGLAGLALATSLPLFLAAWVVLGVGMGIGLYDAAFAALGRQFGLLARTPITVLTLFGGLASTVCWPLTTLLVDQVGWRGACLTYATIHLLLALPAHWLAIPTPPSRDAVAARDGANGAPPVTLSPAQGRVCLWLLAAILTLAQVLVAVMSVHLIGFLRARAAC
jgi:MFS family permease